MLTHTPGAVDLSGVGLGGLSRRELLSGLLEAALANAEEADRADPLRHCGRLAEFYSPDQPRVPAGNPAGGQWMDAGGSPVGRGGQPVYVQDGRVRKGHPSLKGKEIESLSHRGQLKASRESARAEWGKQARYHGHKPEALHQLTAELKAHDAASVEDRTKALQSARKTIESYGGDWRTAAIHAGKGGDASKTRGIDVAAESTARQYPHLFADSEHTHPTDRLFERLAAGNPKAMSEDDAYGQAMEHLDEMRKQDRAARRGGPKAKPAYADDVPFSSDAGAWSADRLRAYAHSYGPVVAQDADSLASHLLRLSAAQLRDLRRIVGLDGSTSSNPALAAQLAGRLRAARGGH